MRGRMVETIVTIPRGHEWLGLLLGGMSGVVLGQLGFWPGLIFTLPLFALMALLTSIELSERKISTVVLSFIAAAALMGSVAT